MAAYHAINACARAVKNFFVNTFCYHSPDDYCEVITRGLRGDKESKNTRYPWLYIRMFTLLFLLFSAYVMTLRLTGNQLFVPTALFFGGIVFTVPFMLFLYELYPKRDLSLIALTTYIIIGGALACFLAQILFYFTPEASGWLGSFRAGGIEEICKTIVTILIIVITGAKNPLAGFLVGAAVGAGYSVVEDMGYLFISSDGWFSSDIPSIIAMFFGRGATAFCTHILWSGLIGYIYVRHNRRLTQGWFYLSVIYAIVLHALWDNPLSGVWNGVIIAACVFGAAVPSIISFVQASRDELGYDVQTEIEIPRSVTMVRTGGFFRHGANLSFAVYAFLLSVCALVYCALPVETVYNTQVFTQTEEFVEFAQNGYPLAADLSRAYDDNLSNAEEHYISGELTQVVQEVERDGYYYYYYYSVSDDTYKLNDIMAEVTDSGVTRRYSCVSIYYRGEVYVTFFPVNGAITGYGVDENGYITAMLYDSSVVTEEYPEEYTPVGYAIAALTAAEIAIYAAFTVKARKVDKQNTL